MTFDFTAEHRALRETVAAFLAEHSDESAVRAAAAEPGVFDRVAWRRLAGELGVVGLLVPESDGGAGAGPVELAIVCEAMGERLWHGPFLSSAVLATALLRELGEHERMGALASGERIATVAIAEAPRGWEVHGLETTGAGGTVTGTKHYVTDARTADELLVVTAHGVVAVDAQAPGVTVEPLRTLDGTRELATVTFDAAPGSVLGPGKETGTAVARTLRLGELMLAAEQAGGARATLDMAVGYAKQRYQFGRAIGSFQAIKHLCADLFVEVESAYSAAYYGAWALAEGSEDVAELAAMCQAFCSEVFVRAASDNIQIHGGIGFTWEHPAHLYLRRARADAQLLGDPATHRERAIRAVETTSGRTGQEVPT